MLYKYQTWHLFCFFCLNHLYGIMQNTLLFCVLSTTSFSFDRILLGYTQTVVLNYSSFCLSVCLSIYLSIHLSFIYAIPPSMQLST